MTDEDRKPISPWQIKVADDFMAAVQRVGRQCEMELTWAGHKVVRVWRDGDGIHVEFPEGGVG